MDPVTIGTIASVAKSLINRVWPDPEKQAEMQLQVAKLEQDGNLAELAALVKQMEGQLSINLEEAKHPSLWVSGWRPAVGWTACAALFMTYVPKAFVITLLWSIQAYQSMPESIPVFPDLGTTDLLGLLGSMLGIGILRSVDKFNGVDTKRHN